MERITFRTEDDLTLEGELWPADGPPRGPAVLCHPHPRYGGSKDHPLLWAITTNRRRTSSILIAHSRG